MPIAMPAGRYLSCAYGIGVDAGGQTRAMFMRNRILASTGGVRPDVLALAPVPDLEQRRTLMVERGLLSDDVRVLGIYEHFRDHGRGDGDAEPAPLADLPGHRIREQTAPDGSPWRVRHEPPAGGTAIYDYVRADGTPYLRIPAFRLRDRKAWPHPIQLVDPAGQVVREFGSIGQWFRRWIRDLAAGHERTFVFVDSRFVMQHLVPLRAPHIHVAYVMHNLHVLAPFNWNSPTTPVYERVLARIDGVDAMVSLTERQRDDIAARRGRTTNMFVVPNPADPPPVPAEPPVRDPRRAVIVGRLAGQKRLTDAIRAFQRVVEAIPDARLDIYGQGPERELLQQEIDSRRLQHAVTLRGYDPRATDALWTASVFLMTSVFEGYPLSVLESMSRGCPVVSYDIRYGPREQITDGVDGFLVAPGDVDALAARVVELLGSPETARRMGDAAMLSARRFGPEEFVRRWAGVLQATVDQKPERTRIREAELQLTRLRPVAPGRLRRLVRRRADFVPGPVPPGGGVELTGVLRLDARSRGSTLDSARLELAAIEHESGTVTELPLTVRRTGSEFRLRALIREADLLPGITDPPRELRLRLRLTWQNSSWETGIVRPARPRAGIDLCFAPDQTVRLGAAAGPAGERGNAH